MRVKERSLQPSKTKNTNNQFESLNRLIQVMRNDEVINKKVIEMLQRDSFQRRAVLNNWLEKLQRQNAPENLLSSLSCLFDDKVAEQVLTLIQNYKI
jgi:ribosomal protein L18E